MPAQTKPHGKWVSSLESYGLSGSILSRKAIAGAVLAPLLLRHSSTVQGTPPLWFRRVRPFGSREATDLRVRHGLGWDHDPAHLPRSPGWIAEQAVMWRALIIRLRPSGRHRGLLIYSLATGAHPQGI